MAGIQYLDELFSAIRDAAERIALAEDWISRTKTSSHPTWRMSFLHEAYALLKLARKRFDDANTQLNALGPPEQLPSLLAAMPARLDELRGRLSNAEKRLALLQDELVATPRGRA